MTGMTETLEQQCRICGCTERDCSQCIERTGKACYWVEEDLCSACTLTTKDLAQYYGSKVKIQFPNTDFYRNGEIDPIDSAFLNGAAAQSSPIEHKPILRPLSDMRHNEATRFVRVLEPEARDIELKILSDDIIVRFKRDSNFPGISYWADYNRVSECSPERHKYLLSRHFDLFGWIGDGLAIDATSLEPNPYEED